MERRRFFGRCVAMGVRWLAKSPDAKVDNYAIDIGKHRYTALVVTRADFSSLLGFVTAKYGMIAYEIGIGKSKEPIYAISHITEDAFLNELSEMTGIIAIYSARGMVSAFSFDGEPDAETINGFLHDVHVKETRKPRDSQRQALYAFESRVLTPYLLRVCSENGINYVMNKKSVQALVNKFITDSNGAIPDYRLSVEVCATKSEIRLGRAYTIHNDVLQPHVDSFHVEVHPEGNFGGPTIHTLLHELAHVATHFLYNGDQASHDGYFIATYCDIMSRYLGVDRATLVDMFKKAGLKVASDNRRMASEIEVPDDEPLIIEHESAPVPVAVAASNSPSKPVAAVKLVKGRISPALFERMRLVAKRFRG